MNPFDTIDMREECKFNSLFNLKSIQFHAGNGFKHSVCGSSEWSQLEKVFVGCCVFVYV